MNATDMLLDARRTTTPIADLPVDVRPANLEEAYFVQDRLAWAYEAIVVVLFDDVRRPTRDAADSKDGGE